MMSARPSNLTRTVYSSALAAMLLVTSLALAAIAQTTRSTLPARSLFVTTSADATWLVRPTLAAEKDAPTWTVLRHHATKKPGDYWIPVTLLSTQPKSVALFGERLAVLYDDGTWSLISSAGEVMGPPAPAGLKLVSVLDGLDHLTFLARSETDARAWSIVEFDGIAFSTPRVAQMMGGTDANEPLLAIVRPGVFFVVERDDYTDIAQSSDGELHAVHATGGVALSSGGLDAVTLALPAGATAGRLTVSHDSNDTARFWWVEGDQVVSRSFAVDGSPKGELETVSVRPPPSPPLFERGLYVVGAITLLLVLLAGGRQTIAVTKAMAAKNPPKPAPLARRFAAGVVDTIPLVATTIYLAAFGKLTLFGGMLKFDTLESEAILAAGVLFYLTLLLAFELRWQKSIGKWIFALRVVSIDGTVPSPKAVLIRNLLRLVDLNLITLLIVPATPLRQRLGDFLAGTMVVDAIDPKSPAPIQRTLDEPADKK